MLWQDWLYSPEAKWDPLIWHSWSGAREGIYTAGCIAPLHRAAPSGHNGQKLPSSL